MRPGVLAVLVVLAGPAEADPAEHVELSAFFGADKLNDRIALGGASEPEQRPQTSPMFGARVGYLVLDTGIVDLGVEAQASFTPSWTGYGFDGPRPSYFSPIIGYRGNAILRLGGPRFHLHVVGGAGGATVATSSPFMKDETEALFFWGPGASFRMAPRWYMRVDLHQAFLPAIGGGTTRTYEMQLGIVATFGKVPVVAPKVQVEVAEPPPRPTPPPEPEIEFDSDDDGVPDKLDRCPNEPAATPDGCPPPDLDGDGIIGAKDKCPNQPEDFDHFQDEDGCPDLDNDGDGIPDAQDACPNEPETKNGFEDSDGCPDRIPPNLTAALAGAAKVRFAAGKARLSDASKTALEPVLALLRAHPAMRVLITGHADGDELAKKRAEVVKWYLVDQGVAADQLDTVAGAAGKASLEMSLTK